MHGKASNVIWMGLKLGDLFVCVVVEDSELKIITSRDEPVLPRDESDAANGDLGHFKCLDDG